MKLSNPHRNTIHKSELDLDNALELKVSVTLENTVFAVLFNELDLKTQFRTINRMQIKRAIALIPK